MILWGILGAGNVANRFAKSLSHIEGACLAAVSCRTQEKASMFAKKYGVEYAYDSYEQLLDDERVQAIYLGLPHGMHKEWAIEALKRGKAVLCEKPATVNAQEMREIADVARSSRILFMEAMKGRFVPVYGQVKKLVENGEIGELTCVETSLCNQMPDALQNGKTYHTQPGQGGCLLDSGIYCAGWLEDYLKGSFDKVKVAADIRNGIDYYIDAWLDNGNISGRVECGFDRKKPREAILYGTKGKIVIEELHRPTVARLYKGEAEIEVLEKPYDVDDFYGQIHHFQQCLEEGRTESEVMPLSASVRCAEILDLIRTGL